MPAFDYYCGDKSEQFSFCRIPGQLITGKAFKELSADAKLLYALMLERMGLSARNGRYDERGRVLSITQLMKSGPFSLAATIKPSSSWLS